MVRHQCNRWWWWGGNEYCYGRPWNRKTYSHVTSCQQERAKREDAEQKEARTMLRYQLVGTRILSTRAQSSAQTHPPESERGTVVVSRREFLHVVTGQS